MTAPDRIWLVGLMGAGKTTVARRAADLLGWEAIDTDSLIEARTGRTPQQIFDDDGEAAFRDIEAEVVASVAGRRDAVIATGGGALTDERNRRAMEGGATVLLHVSPEVALRRCGNGADRPNARRIPELAVTRAPLYRRADATIDTSRGSPGDAAHALAAFVESGAFGSARGRFRLEPDVAAVVTTPGAEYPVVVGDGALAAAGRWSRDVGLGGTAFVLADRRLVDLHLPTLQGSLEAVGYQVQVIPVDASESAKHLGTVSAIYDQLIGQRAERGDFVVNLGGGVVTDMGGFAAATYLRGIAFVHVPTTLLGMTDAAIGGKTGVDHPRGKNLIGAFAQPRLVVIDPTVLRTLPNRELTGGAAELVKHSFILGDEMDPALMADLEATGPAGAASAELIARSVAIKAKVVSEDEREAGRRALLNYGHTVGHAIEAVTGYESVSHGEAVAIGMHAAGRIAVELGMLEQSALERQQALLRAFGLPELMPGIDPDAVMEATRLDKKVRGGAVRWVLLESLGRATVRGGVPDDLVRRVLGDLATEAR